jgi:hypothetical protein
MGEGEMVAMKSNSGMLPSCERACTPLAVIPAKAGIHLHHAAKIKMGSRFRGNDVEAQLHIAAMGAGSAT